MNKVFADKHDIMELTGYAQSTANNLLNDIQHEIEAEGGKVIQGKVPFVRLYKKLGMIDERMQQALMTLNTIFLLQDIESAKSVAHAAQDILKGDYQSSAVLQN